MMGAVGFFVSPRAEEAAAASSLDMDARYEALGERRGALLGLPCFGDTLAAVTQETLDVQAHVVSAGDHGLVLALLSNECYFINAFNTRQPWRPPEDYPSALSWFRFTDATLTKTVRTFRLVRNGTTQGHLASMSTPEKTGTLHWLAAVILWWQARIGEGHTPQSAQVLLGLLLTPAALALLEFPGHAPPHLRVPPPAPSGTPPLVHPPLSLALTTPSSDM